ncbi:S8 family serine peptidase [Lutibacter holmesii]|uniref:S8 family serine peptidase n=1 Tax=Lutibacter holmesii TaxID=1137985 RepID=A0ABW3WNB4_9FLAO
MKKTLLILTLFFSVFSLKAQTEDAWVYFTDKPSEKEFLSSPLKMLTQRSLDRRIRYNISLDFKDIPVEESYVLQLKTTEGIKILARSKWLNALHVQGSQEAITSLLDNNFVASIQFANKSLSSIEKGSTSKKTVSKKNKFEVLTDFDYGKGATQINIMKGEVLHENNFTGEGVQIAVIDGGFPNVDTFLSFERIRNNNQILGGYDFVNRDSNFYTGDSHGATVLSTIAGYVEDEFVGTAPDAHFYLFISEDVDIESPLEESLWVEAAEKADSLGVDIINTSLGYSTFDNPDYDYTYEDMDGNTAFISRGAEIAFSRGMILVNSAGNEGTDAWHYVTAPADSKSVLSVGAVYSFGVIAVAPFSSFGPTADGRLKPDVSAIGAFGTGIDASGNVTRSLFGTSFASPILAGSIACLWQAFPQKTNAEITQLVKESAHLYLNPTDQQGYGVPNFETIFNILIEEIPEIELENVQPFPNPVENELNFKFSTSTVSEVEVVIYNLLGQMVSKEMVSKLYPVKDISYLAKGVYLLQLSYNNQKQTIKLIKK